MKTFGRLKRIELLVLRFGIATMFLATAANVRAQTDSHGAAADPGAAQCGVYAEAYKAGASQYTPYLKYTEGLAKTRDQDESVKRYTKALSESAPAANALWLNNWCSINPLKPFAGAANRLLAELTDPPSDQAKPPSEQGQSIAPPATQPVPSSCRVGRTNYCSGCSVTCNDGTKARCMVGTDSFYHNECFQQAVCRCK